MDAETTEFQDLDKRLASLQRQNRWLAGLTALIALALAATLTAPGDTLRAARFAVDDGRVQRGMWRTMDEQTALILQDREGRWRAMLVVADEGPTLRLDQDDGSPSVILNSLPEGASLLLHDDQGRPRVRLAIEAGEPLLELLDADGNPISRLPGDG